MREMVSQGIGSLGIICHYFGIYRRCGNHTGGLPAGKPACTQSIAGSISRDSTILEFSPTISALVFAGRIGSSIASQIGTMRVTEQIDALEIMGVNTPGYLISPKIIAGVTMIPLLIIISVVLGLTGGYIACSCIHAISPLPIILSAFRTVLTVIVTVCAVKSVVFGFIITSVCSYFGFYTSGGALEVGQSATQRRGI